MGSGGTTSLSFHRQQTPPPYDALQQGLPPRVDPTRERQMWGGISEIELEGSSDEELQCLCNSRQPLIPINQAL